MVQVKPGFRPHQVIVEARGRRMSIADLSAVDVERMSPTMARNFQRIIRGAYGDYVYELAELPTWVSINELPDGHIEVLRRYKTKAAAIAAANLFLRNKKVNFREQLWRIGQWVSKKLFTD